MPPAEDPTDSLPRYHVPLTRLRLTGTRTERQGPDDPDPRVTFQTEVALVVGADPELSFPLPRGDSRAVSDRQVKVTLAEDGRLMGFTLTNTGRGPEIVTAAASVVGTIVGTALGARGVGAPANLRPLSTLQMKLSEAVFRMKAGGAQSPIAARRTRIRKAVDEMQDALIAASKAAVAADATTSIQWRPARIARELSRLRAEAELIETRHQAWIESQTVTTSWDDELWLSLAGCPDETRVAGRTRDAIIFGLGAPFRSAVASTLTRFGVVVCVSDREGPVEDLANGPDAGEIRTIKPHPSLPSLIASEHREAAIVLRAPRAVMVSVYRAATGDGAEVPQLIRRWRQVVVDERSLYVKVPLGSAGWFGKQVRTLTIGPAGGLQELDNADESAVAAAAAAIAGAPAAISSGLETAATALGRIDALRDRGVQREIARLKADEELLRARVAADASDATQGQLLEAAVRRSQIAALEAQRDHGALLAAPDPVAAAAAALLAREQAQLEIDHRRAEIALLQAKAEAARGAGA